jgi:hypothetical protein
MNHIQLNLQKVPTLDQADEERTAWVGIQRQNLESKIVRIQNTDFIVRIAKQLTANDIALNAPTRSDLNLSIGMALNVELL